MNFDLEYIEKLVKMVSDSELTELTLEEKRISNCNKKRKEVVQAQTILPQAVALLLLQCSLHKYLQQQKRKRRSQKRYTDNISYGRYFLYGIFTGGKPFVEVGQTVSAGQVVCIIEAMKLMNEIESEVSGKITEICVKDGEAVEYGQVLMYVE